MPRTIILENAERLLSNLKHVILTAATNADQYHDGDHWQSAGALGHGSAVRAVRHYNRHTSELAEVIAVRSEATGEIVGQFEITSIALIETQALLPEDITAAGFESRDEFLARVGSRRMWYMDVIPVSSSPTQ